MGGQHPFLDYDVWGSPDNIIKFINENDKDFFVELLDKSTNSTATVEVEISRQRREK
jgi:hypothetical protein